MTRAERMIAAAETHGYHGGASAIGTSMRHQQSGNTLDIYDTGARHTVAEGHDTDQHACAHDRCNHVTHVYTIKQLRDVLKSAHGAPDVADNLVRRELER